MRAILHVDLNNFYASVECMINPDLQGKNVAVCGAPEDRHGIILAKSKEAKKLGIKTGMTIWEAKNLAPDLITITANFPLYMKYSKIVRKIFENYTDFIEPFGIDESWLDITQSINLLGSPIQIAKNIKDEIYKKTKLTVSIGVSFNKIFAKLGSDLADNDEILEITENNYQELIWQLPCENLLYVGRKTKKKLNHLNIFTIGDLAQFDKYLLIKKLGKWGEYLHDFANGKDMSPVRNLEDEIPIKSIGNSMTNYKDITNEKDLKIILTLLCESVVSRLRDLGIKGFCVVHAHITKTDLSTDGWQRRLNSHILSSTKLVEIAYNLILQNFNFDNIALRGAGVSVGGLKWDSNIQEKLIEDKKEKKLEEYESCVNKIQKKYGNSKIKKAIVLTDKRLSDMNIKEEHIIYPENFFR